MPSNGPLFLLYQRALDIEQVMNFKMPKNTDIGKLFYCVVSRQLHKLEFFLISTNASFINTVLFPPYLLLKLGERGHLKFK